MFWLLSLWLWQCCLRLSPACDRRTNETRLICSIPIGCGPNLTNAALQSCNEYYGCIYSRLSGRPIIIIKLFTSIAVGKHIVSSHETDWLLINTQGMKYYLLRVLSADFITVLNSSGVKGFARNKLFLLFKNVLISR